MAQRDRSNPYVRGLDEKRANKAFRAPGSRPVGPEHTRKSSDSNRKVYGDDSIAKSKWQEGK